MIIVKIIGKPGQTHTTMEFTISEGKALELYNFWFHYEDKNNNIPTDYNWFKTQVKTSGQLCFHYSYKHIVEEWFKKEFDEKTINKIESLLK